MNNSLKDWIFPTKKNNFKSPLLKNKSLTVYLIFLIFINIMLPYFISSGNISSLSLYNTINKDRNSASLANLSFSRSLSYSASEIIGDISKYQYLSSINPLTNYSYYHFINTNKFSNVNEIILKNYISLNSANSNILNLYKNEILNSRINDIGIAVKNINFYGNTQQIIIVLTAKGNNTSSQPALNISSNLGLIDYTIITYTDMFILIFLIFLILSDVLFSYYYNNFKNKSIPYMNLILSFITMIVVLILILGVIL